MGDDATNLSIVAAADPIDLLDETAVLNDETRVQGIALLECLQRAHGDSRVEIVRARLEDVTPLTRSFVRQNRIEGDVEKERSHPIDQACQ